MYDAMSISITKWLGIITWPMLISTIQVGGHHYEEHLTLCFTLGKTTVTSIDEKIGFSVVLRLMEQLYLRSHTK